MHNEPSRLKNRRPRGVQHLVYHSHRYNSGLPGLERLPEGERDQDERKKGSGMNEKNYRITIIVLAAFIFLVGACAGWLLTRANRRNEALARDITELEADTLTLGSSLAEYTERSLKAERERDELDQRYRELGNQIPGFTGGLGAVGSGLSGIESGITRAAEGIQSAGDGISEVTTGIGAYLEAAENIQNDDLDSGADSSGTDRPAGA